jgi:hypothetical protein
VSGTISGQPVLMLLDTGANSHVIAGWLARKLALPMQKLGDVGTDHVGKSIATYRVDNPAIAIDDWGPLAVTTALATEVPSAIEKLGIGAFISPQRLDEEGDATMVDLAKGEIRAAWWDVAFGELSMQENDGPVKGLAFVVPATIDAHEVELLVDTGAQHSDVFTTSPVGKTLAAQSATNGEPMYTPRGRFSLARSRLRR